jgi:transcriptional regulator with XRE-family HTH domain
MPKSVFTDAYASLVDEVVALRKQKDVSQVELAERLGKTQQFVSSIERRVRRLDVIELYALVQAIGGDPEELVLKVYRRLPRDVRI